VDRGRCYAVRIMNRENCEIKCHATGVVGDQCHFYVGGATVVETVIFTWVVPRWNGTVIFTWAVPRWNGSCRLVSLRSVYRISDFNVGVATVVCLLPAR
jgi:hypothetical protein